MARGTTRPVASPLVWPDDVPDDLERTRRARERLLDGGLFATPAPDGVRSVIERSWRRCIGDAVPADPSSLPYHDVDGLAPRLCTAAAPVLDRLGEQLGRVRVAMFVSDEAGRIVMRRVGEPGQRGELDGVSAAEGFDYSEDAAGTNGLGSVLHDRAPLLVHGTEHFSSALQSLTCAGVPLHEPFSGALLGTFALACSSADAGPLLCAMATDVGRQIEGNLLDTLGDRERALIRAYLVAARSERDPVIVVTERSAFANGAGLPFVTGDAHALLWLHLSGSGIRRQIRTTVPMPSGWMDAVVEHVDGPGAAGSAYCVRLLGEPLGEPHALPGAGRTPVRGQDRPGAPRCHPVPEVNEQLFSALEFGETVALVGGPGTGKRYSARAALRRRSHEDPRVVDLSRSACPDDLGGSGGIVLAHLQDLPRGDVYRVRAAILSSSGPVILTVDPAGAGEYVHALLAQIGTAVELPGLAAMATHIPRLVSGFVDELAAAQRPRFASDTLQLLMQWSWPGNVAELRSTVQQLAHRMPGRTVSPTDLPHHLRPARGRTVGMLECAERDAIVSALRSTNGNRSRAADLLGIGRTTLYRKIQSYGIRA